AAKRGGMPWLPVWAVQAVLPSAGSGPEAHSPLICWRTRIHRMRSFATPHNLGAQIRPDPRVVADDVWAKLLWAGLIAATVAILERPSVRLLTLTGPAGTGKTRLALAAASATAENFAHGAVFVDLAPAGDPAHVLVAIAHALGLHQADQNRCKTSCANPS